MFFIDTHTHIYLPEFDTDRAECLKRATDNGITELYLPAIDASTHEKMLQIEAEYPACRAMIGLHPCSIKEDTDKELEIIGEYLEQRKFIAVGEIGLDFYWDKTFIQQQYEAFHRQIEMAVQYNMPVVIHSREAIDECIEVVKEHSGTRGVFHCFSGNLEQAQEIIAMGMLLGIGGVVSFKNSGLDKVIAHTGLSHVVLETDAPYLAPVPFRGKRNEPAYTRLVAEKLAQVCNVSIEEVGTVTTKNAKNLFSA